MTFQRRRISLCISFVLCVLLGSTSLGGASAVAQESPPPPAGEAQPPEAEPPEAEPPVEGASEADEDAADATPLLWRLADQLHALPVTGRLSTRYRLRWNGDDSDQDAYALLSLDAGDPDTSPVTAHFLGRGSADLDGTNRGEFDVFGSIEDTFDHATNGRLYDAFLDFHRIPYLDVLRVGRQRMHETPEMAWFDGVRAETGDVGKLRVRLGGYGGIPVHLYESSPGGDYLVGTYGESRPWGGGRVRLDWMVAWDDTRGEDFRDNLLGFDLWQEVSRGLELHGHYSRLDGKDRDLRLQATYTDPELDLRVRVAYDALLERQKAFAQEFDPFFASLFEYEPYNQGTLFVSKGIGENLVVDGGVSVRQLRDDSDESAFNHEFERYFVTPTLIDLPWEGLSLSVTGEAWQAGNQDIRGLGFDATQELNERWKASIGTYYSLFKYDLFSSSERDDVRTYYVRIEHRFSRALRLNAEYAYEDDDFDEYSTVKVGATWSF